MSLSRSSSTLRYSRRAWYQTQSPALRKSPTALHRFYATQSYGGGEGDPKGENPQDQGPSSTASHSKEHPGPPSPGTQSNTSGASSDSSKGPQPKIHNHTAPNPDSHSEEVRQHNEEMSRRHDRPTEKSEGKDEKVDKNFWKGEFTLCIRSLHANSDQLIFNRGSGQMRRVS